MTKFLFIKRTNYLVAAKRAIIAVLILLFIAYVSFTLGVLRGTSIAKSEAAASDKYLDKLNKLHKYMQEDGSILWAWRQYYCGKSKKYL